MGKKIKFRSYSYRTRTMYSWEELLDDDLVGLFKHEQEELMQFTGLLDENGQEIYEGDIVTTDWLFREGRKKHGGKCGWEVLFKDGHYFIKRSGRRQEVDYLSRYSHKCEVVGNVCENPEELDKYPTGCLKHNDCIEKPKEG